MANETTIPNVGTIALTSLRISNNTNINDLKTPGVYFAGSAANIQGLPEGTNGYVIVFGQTNYMKQIFTRIGTAGSTDNNLYIRNVNSAEWWKFTPNPVIVETGSWYQIGSVAANGGTLTVEKTITAKTGYTPYLTDLHLSESAVGSSWSKITFGYTQDGNTVTIGVTNNHTSSLNPTMRYTIVYVAN